MIDETKLPKHIAIIMDGNGRWAKSKGKNRIFGHRNGTQAVQIVVETAAKLKIEHLTLYAFSTENWSRPKKEVSTLMDLLIRSLRKELKKMVKNNIISPENVDETIINEHLYTQNLPAVDLLIRTSGEQRISNFLLWQIAYAELYFSEVLWPDFKKEHFEEAITSYQKRERRFGKTSEQLIS